MNSIDIDKFTEEMAALVTDTIETIIKSADKNGVGRDAALSWFATVIGQLSSDYSIANYDLNGPRHPLAAKHKEGH